MDGGSNRQGGDSLLTANLAAEVEFAVSTAELPHTRTISFRVNISFSVYTTIQK